MIRSLPIILIVLLLVKGVVLFPQWRLSETDGQPGCRTEFELTRLWRHNFLPQQYFECIELGRAGVLRFCPPETIFQSSWQTCVPKTTFIYYPTYDPPSRPDVLEHSVTECPPCETTPEEITTTPTVCPPC